MGVQSSSLLLQWGNQATIWRIISRGNRRSFTELKLHINSASNCTIDRYCRVTSIDNKIAVLFETIHSVLERFIIYASWEYNSERYTTNFDWHEVEKHSQETPSPTSVWRLIDEKFWTSSLHWMQVASPERLTVISWTAIQIQEGLLSTAKLDE